MNLFTINLIKTLFDIFLNCILDVKQIWNVKLTDLKNYILIQTS